MRFYRILPTESNEWKDYLPAFMTVATASGDTLTFDWRLVYQVAFSKEPSSSPIYHAMELQDKMGNQSFENLEEFNDDKRMKKEYLNVNYFETILKDQYNAHPKLTPLKYQEEYKRMVNSEDYIKTLDKINALVAKNLD